MRDHRHDPPITTDITDRLRSALEHYERRPRPTKPPRWRDDRRARNRQARASRKRNRR